MGDDQVAEVGTGSSEHVDKMANGRPFIMGLLKGREPVGVAAL